jgi:hypothetical protein
MNPFGRWLWGWIRKLAKVDNEPIVTRHTKEEALEIARRHLMGEHGELPLPGAEPEIEDGRVVWGVITNVGYRGGHSRVFIDDETGDVIRTMHVPL